MKKMVQMMLVAGAVMAFANAAKAQVNLVTRDMTMTTVGSNRVCKVLVSNTGRAHALRSGFLSLYVNPTAAPACGSPSWSRQPLTVPAPGTSKWFTFVLGLPSGSCRILAFADSTCVIKETNELDNQLGRIFTLP